MVANIIVLGLFVLGSVAGVQWSLSTKRGNS